MGDQIVNINSPVVVDQVWTDLKASVSSKSLAMQYGETSSSYTIFALDGPIAYRCNIFKTDVSGQPIYPPYYSQAQNDIDKADFTANFKPIVNQRVSLDAGNKLNTSPVATLETMAALGLIPNAVSGRANGYAAAATVAFTNIRAAVYLPQATDGQRSVKSSSALDTAAGSGCRTVVINYLNSAMVLKQDTVVLNGLTAVNTNATDIRFIENMVCGTTGADVSNDGNIQLFTGLAGAGSVMAQMNTFDSATFYDHHYVPIGVTCYVLGVTSGATLGTGRGLLIRTGDPRATNLPLLQIGDIALHLTGASIDHNYDVPIVVPGPDLIIGREFPIAAVALNTAYGSFDYVQF
jgi:hypothetical protein